MLILSLLTFYVGCKVANINAKIDILSELCSKIFNPDYDEVIALGARKIKVKISLAFSKFRKLPCLGIVFTTRVETNLKH